MGVFVKDRRGRYRYLNKRWGEALGRRTGKCLGKTDLDLWPPEVAASLLKGDSGALASKGSLEVVRSSSEPDGTARYWVVAKFPIGRSATRRSIGGVAVDLTQHILAEEKLARLNRIHAMLSKVNRTLAQTPVPQVLFDDACRTAIEDGGFRMAWIGLVDPTSGLVRPVAKSGFDDGFLDGVKSSLVDQPDGQSPTSLAIRERAYSISNDIERDQSLGPWRTKAYVRGYRSCASFPIMRGGRVMGALTLYSGEKGFFGEEEIHLLSEMCADISTALERVERERERSSTDEKLDAYSTHLEDMLEDRSRRIREAERMATIGRTALMVGHDLRNPLQSITYALYQIRDVLDGLPDVPSAPRKKASVAVATIDSQIRYMDKIVSDLHDYAKPLVLEPIEVDLAALVKDTLSGIDVPKSVRVSVEVEDGAHRLKVDPTMMTRAFACLINNAIDAMPRGGDLRVSAVEADGMVSVSFEDSGIGISKENLSKLSTPFFTTKPRGMGFGLAISRRIVEAHGGSVLFESIVGRGTTVTVNIPLGPPVKPERDEAGGMGRLMRFRRLRGP